MSAETLREAARLMRERAEGATAGPWMQNGFEYDDVADEFTYDIGPGGSHVSIGYTEAKPDADYIASMHPAVALAVADLLEVLSRFPSQADPTDLTAALAVADAYLGDVMTPDVCPTCGLPVVTKYSPGVDYCDTAGGHADHHTLVEAADRVIREVES